MEKKNYKVVAIALAIIGLFTALLISYLVNKANEKVDYSKYDLNGYIRMSKDNGYISDHIKGDLTAPVLLVEYADFQCPGCAQLNPRLNTIVDEYKNQVGIIYRNYILSYHQNGTAAASAAEAAGNQGYWNDYADLLFSNQSLWEDLSGDERTDYFVDLFGEMAGDNGDLEQFRKDISSTSVAKKISFDMGMAKLVGVPSTPGIYLDGEHLDFTQDATTEAEFMKFMYDHIDAKLKEQGITPPEHKSTTDANSSAEIVTTSEVEE